MALDLSAFQNGKGKKAGSSLNMSALGPTRDFSYKRQPFEKLNMSGFPIQPEIVIKAMAQQESSGGLKLKGGSGETGALHIMGSTWPGVSKEVFGEVRPQTSQNEMTVARFKVDQWIKKGFGVEDMAKIWNTSLGAGEKHELPLNKKGVNEFGQAYDSVAHGKAVKKYYDQFVVDFMRDSTSPPPFVPSAVPSGIGQSTRATISPEEGQKIRSDLLSVPDFASGAAISLPYRASALARGQSQPRLETMTEQVTGGLKETGLPPNVAVPAGIALSMIGDPFNFVGGGAAKAGKILNLIDEAKKYKSAEEFVKAQGKPLLHFTDEANLASIEKGGLRATPSSEGKITEGISLATKRTEANEIFGNGKASVFLDPQAKTITLKDALEKMGYGKETDMGVIKNLETKAPSWAVKNGYDVLDMRAARGAIYKGMDEIRVLNPDVIKTKSQLTDIYNSATRAKTVVPQTTTTGGRLTKQVIKENTGLAPANRVTRTANESTLLKERLQQQSIGSKAGLKEGVFLGRQTGFREGMEVAGKTISKQEAVIKTATAVAAKKEAVINVLRNTAESVERVKQVIVEHVKDALSPAERGKAITLVRDAASRKDLAKAFTRINQWAEQSVKKELRNDILTAQKKIMDSEVVATDYKAQIKELLGDFELTTRRADSLKKLQGTRKFLLAEAAKGNKVEIPREVLKSLEALYRTPFEEMTINQLKGLKAEVELLQSIGETKFAALKAAGERKKAKILDAVAEQGAKPLADIEVLRPEIGERLTVTQKLRNLVSSAANKAARLDRVIAPMDTIFDLLDGGKGLYGGANFRFFKANVDAGYGRYISRKESLQEPVVELIQKFKLDDTNMERIGVVAAREQDGGIDKLVSMGFTEEQVGKVVLSKQEQEVLDQMRATFDSQFDEIRDTMRRVYNKPVEKVKNYFSFMTDFDATSDLELFERFGTGAPSFKKKNVDFKFTMSRTGGDQAIKINALDVFLAHTDNTSYLLELGETSKMLGEVAASPKYGELVGDAGQLLVREWVDVVARKGGADGGKNIAILDMLRRNAGAGILGLKLSTIMIQPTSLIDGAGFIGARYTTSGVTNFLSSSEWRKFVVNMPEIIDRVGGEAALRELTDKNWLQHIQRKGFIPMQKVDQVTAGAIAAGAYERKMIELGLEIDLSGAYNPEALAYAQLAVRRTQSSGSFKDVPLAVSRGALTGNRSLDRAMFQFQNFLLTRWSRIRHDAIRAGINTKDPTKAIPILTTVIMSALAVSGIRLGVNQIQDLITGREDEDTPSEDIAKSFGYEMAGNIPFMGTMMGMALYDGEMFPVLDAPKGIISGLNRVINSKSESAKLRGLSEFGGSFGAMLGIPGSAQAESLVRGALRDKKVNKNNGAVIKIPKITVPKVEIPKI